MDESSASIADCGSKVAELAASLLGCFGYSGSVLLAVLAYSALRAWFSRSLVCARLAVNPTPVTAAEFAEHGLGPVSASDGKGGSAEANRALYLDVMKRAIINVLFLEVSKPSWFYGADRTPVLAREGGKEGTFSLSRRVLGEDMPANSFSMVGLHRLNNIQSCLETAIEECVPGDFVETGAYRGGACIFARAVLKAHGVTDRNVVACDTFTPPKQPPTLLGLVIVMPILWGIQLLSLIPLKPLRMALFKLAESVDQDFPAQTQDPKLLDDWIALFFFFLHNLTSFHATEMSKGLETVKSYFARFGLLDGQVRFLQGFFADTIPSPEAAFLTRVAVLRADGDTYESTMDALRLLYPKVSPGGFVIIDDYHSFVSCAKAVDEFRAEHGIEEKMHRIDNLSVYWRTPKK